MAGRRHLRRAAGLGLATAAGVGLLRADDPPTWTASGPGLAAPQLPAKVEMPKFTPVTLPPPAAPVAVQPPKAGELKVPPTGIVVAPPPVEPAPLPRPGPRKKTPPHRPLMPPDAFWLRQTPEVAPPARPAKLPEAARPADPAGSDFRLRAADPGLTLNPGSPPATPAPAPGAAPVLTPKSLLMSATLGAALATAPAPAQDSTKSGGGLVPPEAGKADPVLKAQLDAVKEDVAKLRESNKELSDAIFGKRDGKSSPADSGLVVRMSDLLERLNKIDERLKALDERLAGLSKSTSGFGPSPAPAPAPTPVAKSVVRLVNDYQTDLTIILNRVAHKLNPGEVKTVEVPAGSYTYELLVPGGQPTTATLKDGETITLRIK